MKRKPQSGKPILGKNNFIHYRYVLIDINIVSGMWRWDFEFFIFLEYYIIYPSIKSDSGPNND